MNKFSLLGLACAATLIGSSSLASAQERVPEPPADANGGTVVNAPPGSGGLTVVAPTPGGGTVVANGCSQVMVNGSPTYVTPSGEPCPQQYAPYEPYGSRRSAYDVKPRYARDSERTGALIASSVVWGVGSAVTGIAYLVAKSETSYDCAAVYDSTGTYTTQNCTTNHHDATGALVTYGAIVSITPSVPRFVMGDVGKGLLYTGIRAASVLVASVVDWGHNDTTSWEMPFLLGFCVPVALGIVDLVTTPHREDLEEKAAQATGVTSIAPVALSDARGTHGGMLALAGRF
jgi:hypothetical protein